jgi:hypothetical protein
MDSNLPVFPFLGTQPTVHSKSARRIVAVLHEIFEPLHERARRIIKLTAQTMLTRQEHKPMNEMGGEGYRVAGAAGNNAQGRPLV